MKYKRTEKKMGKYSIENFVVMVRSMPVSIFRIYRESKHIKTLPTYKKARAWIIRRRIMEKF